MKGSDCRPLVGETQHPGTARTGVCPDTSSSGSQFPAVGTGGSAVVEAGVLSPPLLSAGAGDPVNTLSFTTAVPGAWPQLHRRTAAGKFIAHAEPALKDNFPTIVPSFIVFSASSACRCSICNGRCSMAGSPWG